MILQKYEEFYAPANIWDKLHKNVRNGILSFRVVDYTYN